MDDVFGTHRHDRVLVLGYVSEFGVTDMIAAALGTISDVGLRAWVVPGNHDVALSTNALSTAAETLTSNVALETDHPRQCEGITVCGHGLRSRDGGQTCQATNLPDPARFHSRLLLSATHYPLLSQHAYLRVAGLRYPGDLLNLDEARAAAERAAADRAAAERTAAEERTAARVSGGASDLAARALRAIDAAAYSSPATAAT